MSETCIARYKKVRINKKQGVFEIPVLRRKALIPTKVEFPNASTVFKGLKTLKMKIDGHDVVNNLNEAYFVHTDIIDLTGHEYALIKSNADQKIGFEFDGKADVILMDINVYYKHTYGEPKKSANAKSIEELNDILNDYEIMNPCRIVMKTTNPIPKGFSFTSGIEFEDQNGFEYDILDVEQIHHKINDKTFIMDFSYVSESVIRNHYCRNLKVDLVDKTKLPGIISIIIYCTPD